jgi:hypothetical protein
MALAVLLRLEIPIHQQRDRRRRGVEHRVDEEAPVAGDIVLPTLLRVQTAAIDARGKQRPRRARLSVALVTVIGAAIITPASLRSSGIPRMTANLA